MRKRFRRHFDALLRSEGGIVAAILREEEEAICEGFPIDSPGPSRQRGYVNQTPAVKILRGALERPEDAIPKAANQAGGAYLESWEAAWRILPGDGGTGDPFFVDATQHVPVPDGP